MLWGNGTDMKTSIGIHRSTFHVIYEQLVFKCLTQIIYWIVSDLVLTTDDIIYLLCY